MNYWPVEILNLSELHEPLLNKIPGLCENGQTVAREFYQSSGTVCHHNTDIWNHCLPVGTLDKKGIVYSSWPFSLAWLSAHLWTHFTYTLDLNFLEKVCLPTFEPIVRFYSEQLEVSPRTGKLIFPLANSPENTYVLQGEDLSVARSTAMAQSLIRELFSNYLHICRILARESEFSRKIAGQLADLQGLEISRDGRIKEWDEEYEETDLHHRHISHLYGLFPGEEINYYDTPELAKACAKSLQVRGDESTGWSMGWKALCYARLHNAQKARQILSTQLRPVDPKAAMAFHGGSYPNLFSAHPPFQIDGNFATAAALAAIFLHSRFIEYDQDHVVIELELLPALAEEFGSGKITGLCVKGGFTINISYDRGELREFDLYKGKLLIWQERAESKRQAEATKELADNKENKELSSKVKNGQGSDTVGESMPLNRQIFTDKLTVKRLAKNRYRLRYQL